MGKLTVVRNKSVFGVARRMEIIVDNESVGKVANGEDMELNVTEGVHTLKVKQGLYYKSTDFTFAMTGDESKTIFVGPSVMLNVAMIVLALAALLVVVQTGKSTTLAFAPAACVLLLQLGFRNRLITVKEF